MMAPVAGDRVLTDEERLPWLETVEETFVERAPMGRVVVIVIAALLLVGAAVGALYWFQDRPATGDGSGQLIAAPPGDYKIKPEEPGGMQVAGEGDSVFKASDGGEIANGSVDLSAIPEAPLATGPRPAPAAMPTPKPAATRVSEAVPPPSGRLEAEKRNVAVAKARPAPGGATGAFVQIGSFPSSAAANTAWKQLSGRFSYLAALGQSIQVAEVNGRTVHRLRVGTGSNAEARQVCGKLKVAGEPCFVVAQ